MKFLLSIFIILQSHAVLYAQNITGSWETIRNEEFMQFNIEQRKNELCGYTFDYETNNRRSYCKADFEGRFDTERQIWYLQGTRFIENSGSHVLMRILLWQDEGDLPDVLRGKIFLQSSGSSLFGSGGDDVIVRKVSDKPIKIKGQRPCFPPQPKPAITKKEPIPSKPVKPKSEPIVVKPAKPVSPKPKEVSKLAPVKPVEPIKKTPVPVIVEKKKEEVSLLQRKMSARKQVEQSRVVIHTKRINLKLYDNGTVDGDSISVFYNGKLLVSNQRLSEKAIELNIDLDITASVHKITMYAENLGTIIPNTALVVVTAGANRYELRSKANLEENAVLVFEYQPKE